MISSFSFSLPSGTALVPSKFLEELPDEDEEGDTDQDGTLVNSPTTSSSLSSTSTSGSASSSSSSSSTTSTPPTVSQSSQLVDALIGAAREGQLAAVRRLVLEEGANVNGLSPTDPNGNTALIHACMHGHTSVAMFLLRECPLTDLNRRSRRGFTALFWAVVENNVLVVQALLRKTGLDVNARERAAQWTALHCASYKGHLQCVQLLLEHDEIDVSLPDGDGKTALDLARDSKHWVIHKELLRYALKPLPATPRTKPSARPRQTVSTSLSSSSSPVKVPLPVVTTITKDHARWRRTWILWSVLMVGFGLSLWVVATAADATLRPPPGWHTVTTTTRKFQRYLGTMKLVVQPPKWLCGPPTAVVMDHHHQQQQAYVVQLEQRVNELEAQVQDLKQQMQQLVLLSLDEEDATGSGHLPGTRQSGHDTIQSQAPQVIFKPGQLTGDKSRDCNTADPKITCS